MNYVNLVIDNRNKNTDRFYTYSTEFNLKLGDVVMINFAKGNKLRMAFVVEIDVVPDFDVSKIKPVKQVFTKWRLTKESVETALWMKRRYGIRYIDGLKLFSNRGNEAKRKSKDSDEVSKKNISESKADLPVLTDEQSVCLDAIYKAIEKQGMTAFLLDGVTGSGKTEVYMRAAGRVIGCGKQVIYLVPEISLIEQTFNRLADRFGKDCIAVLHSKMSKGKLYKEWMKVYRGEAKIVLGARMAVFAPVSSLGLLVIDEEHENSYKSDMTPKYETLDIAYRRCNSHGATLILGSATPSVNSYYLMKQGILKHLILKERYNKVELPEIEVVDMNAELREGNNGIFSNKLYEEMKFTLKQGRQIILFVNRRGYSNYIACRDCGEPMTCPNCGITLTYHKEKNKAICHYCGRQFEPIKICSHCGSSRIRQFGFGTEKIEEYVEGLFPGIGVVRLDLDTAKSEGEIKRIINDFRNGKSKILIGTQLVAKSLDFKNVDLVGVVNADVSLNASDYRATERTYQLITQVSGRAGRGERKGKVIVQTHNPDNFAILTASSADFERFFNKEIGVRNLLRYPPFSDIISIAITGRNRSEVNIETYNCASFIKDNIKIDSNLILDRREDILTSGNDKFKFEFLIKCPKDMRNQVIYWASVYGNNLAASKKELNLLIDVNPY